MKFIPVAITSLVLFTGVAFAAQPAPTSQVPAANQTISAKDRLVDINITMPLQAQGWVNASSANVTVNINAAVNQANLANVRADILKKLQAINAKTQWHLVSFSRSKDASDLERVNAQAQGRIPMSQEAGIREKAKKISVQGQQYTIGNIDYTPSFADQQSLRAALRDDIYQKAIQAMDTMNKRYHPHYRYVITKVNFMPQTASPRIQPMMLARTDESMPVSQKVVMTAEVTLTAKTLLQPQVNK